MAVGVAFDIGTTTIVGSARESAGSKPLGVRSLPNPQAEWGGDVLSRVRAVTDDPALLEKLRDAVVGACDGIVKELAGTEEVEEITAAGNTVMEHLLLGVSPAPLSKVPYRPVFKEARRMKAREAGFSSGPETTLYTFPMIGGFIGGDAVAVALALGLKGGGTAGTVLAIDIGTNSELLLSTPDGLFAASAAAGPAFEGGELKHGMTAQSGAIEGVRVEEDRVTLDVIGQVAPRGICGSGLVDAAAALLLAGVIDHSGRIKDSEEVQTNLSTGIRKDKEGNAFVLFRGGAGEVTLSQPDVRALQVAKAAIRAGMTILLGKAGVAPEAIEKVYIAGAFGSNLKEDSLAAIGLIDGAWLGKIEFVGDAALKGAEAVLLSDERKAEAEDIARTAKYVPLSGNPRFEGEFISNMNFS
ncbi:MAG: ASKHA domain-containing protein [Thermodesulfobacteriota bacterium]